MKTMFKTFGFIALIAIIGFSVTALTLTGCDNGNGNDPCASRHTFPEWTAPTCTVDGNNTRTCTKCTQTDTRTTGYTKLGCEGEDIIPATCLAVGFIGTGDCIRCGEPATGEEIDALGHDLDWQEKSFGIEIETCQNAECEETGEIRLTLALGDTGPAGGKIIYVAPTIAGFEVTSTTAAFTTYTAYYLEAAPANAVSGRWSTRSTSPYPDVTGTLLTIGSGRNNTALIIAAEKAASSDTYIYAALACDNYSVAEFNDWFLPSRDELNHFYNRRADFGLSSSVFWSSSQVNIAYAWIQSLYNGAQSDLAKYFGNNVRPVRAF